MVMISVFDTLKKKWLIRVIGTESCTTLVVVLTVSRFSTGVVAALYKQCSIRSVFCPHKVEKCSCKNH